LFPDGVEVGQGIADLHQTVALTRQALELACPLFKAAFATEHGYARVDSHRWPVTISSVNAQDSAPTFTGNKVEA